MVYPCWAGSERWKEERPGKTKRWEHETETLSIMNCAMVVFWEGIEGIPIDFLLKLNWLLGGAHHKGCTVFNTFGRNKTWETTQTHALQESSWAVWGYPGLIAKSQEDLKKDVIFAILSNVSLAKLGWGYHLLDRSMHDYILGSSALGTSCALEPCNPVELDRTGRTETRFMSCVDVGRCMVKTSWNSWNIHDGASIHTWHSTYKGHCMNWIWNLWSFMRILWWRSMKIVVKLIEGKTIENSPLFLFSSMICQPLLPLPKKCVHIVVDGSENPTKQLTLVTSVQLPRCQFVWQSLFR